MKHLFRISTKKSNVWSNVNLKPVYYVATSKEAASERITDAMPSM
jgi:hypothetical protein